MIDKGIDTTTNDLIVAPREVTEIDSIVAPAVAAIGELLLLLPSERRMEALQRAVTQEIKRKAEADEDADEDTLFKRLFDDDEAGCNPYDEIYFMVRVMAAFVGIVNE
jgi:hypothetical protein